MQKDFDNWNELKKKLEKREKFPSFQEREIWWMNLGLNIGNEQCGKGNRLVRPVLILKKFNNHFFFGVPMSSIQKDNIYYSILNLKIKISQLYSVNLNHSRQKDCVIFTVELKVNYLTRLKNRRESYATSPRRGCLCQRQFVTK